MKVEISEVEENDAIGMIELKRLLAIETKFMMRELEEVNEDLNFEIEMIKNINKELNRTLWVSKVDNEIVGFIMIEKYSLIRRRHISRLIIGIQKKYWGVGIGKDFIEKAIDWAKSRNVRRIELEVVAENNRAISFYKKFGFVEEGRKNEDYYVGNNKYMDSLIMCKVM